jgi:hypothetical protein
MTPIYHLHFADGRDFYYGSIKAITDHHSHAALGVGRDTLYRVDWKEGYSNDKIKIKKSVLHSTHTVKALKRANEKIIKLATRYGTKNKLK